MRSHAFLALVPLLLALAAPARAQPDSETLDRILPEIRAAHPGRLSDAQPWIDDTGGRHYRIKWMTFEGRILYFDANARTGRFSSSPGDEHWRDGGSGRQDGERAPPSEDRGRHHDNFTGDSFGWPRGDWRSRGDDGDWRDRASGGDWRGHGGDGVWRGDHGAGDNGGWHHNGHGGH